MKGRRDFWLLVAMVVLFVAGSVMTIRNTAGDEEARLIPVRTSYSAGPGGAKAAYVLLDRLGFRVARWRRPLDRPPREAKVILLIDPLPNMLLSSRENLGLARWMNDGGVLISYNGLPRVFPGQEDLSAARRRGDRSLVKPSGRNDYLGGVRALDVRTPSRIRENLKSVGYMNILGDHLGVIAAYRDEKKGRAIAIADPCLIANLGIGRADNAVFLANLVAAHARKGDLVVFDEYHQGRGIERSLGQIVGKYGRAAFVQLLALLVIALYSYGRRFGEVRSGDREERRVSFEFVEAMAGAYQRAGARSAAIQTLFAAFRRDLAVRLGLPEDAGLDVLAKAAAAAWSLDRNALEELLLRCDRIAGGGDVASDAEMVRLAAEMQRFRKETGIDR